MVMDSTAHRWLSSTGFPVLLGIVPTLITVRLAQACFLDSSEAPTRALPIHLQCSRQRILVYEAGVSILEQALHSSHFRTD